METCERVWTDHCHHPEDSYLGTVWVDRDPYDVYLYRERGTGWMSCCWRYGDEAHQYVSPGPLKQLATRMREPCYRQGEEGGLVECEHPEHYQRAFELTRRVLSQRLADSCEARGEVEDDILFKELAAYLRTFA